MDSVLWTKCQWVVSGQIGLHRRPRGDENKKVGRVSGRWPQAEKNTFCTKTEVNSPWLRRRDGERAEMRPRGQKEPDHLGHCKLGHRVWTLSREQWVIGLAGGWEDSIYVAEGAFCTQSRWPSVGEQWRCGTCIQQTTAQQPGRVNYSDTHCEMRELNINEKNKSQGYVFNSMMPFPLF